jgi:hypothetical protein
LADIFGNRRIPNPKPGAPINFNSYAAGDKKYGSGRSMPNIGPVSGMGMMGYANREQRAKARKDAIMRRLKAQQSGNVMNSNILGVM